jgi:transcriptional regulator with XRE-family HTH domain
MSQEAGARKKGVADSVAEDPLGKKIRKRRRAMDMTLQQVSERVGLSIGFLSQIERGASTPSLASLCNIAEALGTSVDAFVKAPPRATGAVSRPGEREAFSLGDARRTYELLGAGFADARLHPTLVRRPPGHVSEIMHNEGEDFVYIIEGCILLEVGGERHILNKGDSMHFQSHLPHRSATLGNETTLELWVRTQPLFS